MIQNSALALQMGLYFLNRGNELYVLGNYQEAIRFYNLAIPKLASPAEAHKNKGTAFFALNRFNDALDAYNMATVHKQDYAVAYFNKGIVLQILNRDEEALPAFDNAIQYNPDAMQKHIRIKAMYLVN